MNALAFTTADALNLLYLLAAVLFIVGLKMLSKVNTAARGNLVSAGGMLLAACVTLFLVIQKNYADYEGLAGWALVIIFAAIAIGALIGLVLALKVPMTGMPEMVALLNGFGGIASLLVACGDFFRFEALDLMARVHQYHPDIQPDQTPADAAAALGLEGTASEVLKQIAQMANRPIHELAAIGLATLIGGVTFSGSLVAFAKLKGLITGKPILFAGQKAINAVLLAVCVSITCGIAGYVFSPDIWPGLLTALAVGALVLGVLLVIPIGGADMPVVISLLNSYSGLAAAMAGFVLGNQALIITGALVGASGIILTNIMCKAMNRSLANVLFGGVGAGPSGGGGGGSGRDRGDARAMSAETVAIQLDAASRVVIVPGYGMAVAQAQHAVKELADELEKRSVEVLYAIHPVAGRMPGHMNVLLAEANVPYEELRDLDQINPEFPNTDVALVIGANDVTNPAARTATDSPIYGMPILDVDKSRSVVVIKRSLNPGFAGIENELYFEPNCGMLFGDGKAMINALVDELREL